MNPRATVGVVVSAAVAAAVVWFFGVGVVQSLAVGGVVAAVGLTWTAISDGVPAIWPVLPVRSAPGARRELSETAWALRSRGGVPERALARARAVARHRLRTLHRLDLDDPHDRDAAEALMPAAVVTVLLRERGPELDLATFANVLGAVEALGDTDSRTPGRAAAETGDDSSVRTPGRPAAETGDDSSVRTPGLAAAETGDDSSVRTSSRPTDPTATERQP
ncbi:hypothetical protein JOE58_001667 [Curtobacterium luteum]|uniref:Uncharacterized protein n=1 Tax=Curtobacterium luteum TaxID=33881 RepID=A0ABS2RTR7_9MICO|nr:hypothetical protein [Curtobacterium luteum]MBM7802416.1 hypothetical protein [Curtobacterium luteum]NUU50519.1 hypothetical protein [Curtobacterium luteum]